MIQFMSFGPKWRTWIQACLISSMTSILLNGSPINEFQLHMGLRQGDPLSHFLFILVMEWLHVTIDDAKEANLFFFGL